ncbi:MAG: hypothetical protein S4CHLAM6_02460 [Chlamydiae bacterium]|nr:hypothetical protein [Chlamydiota bacterium]
MSVSLKSPIASSISAATTVRKDLYEENISNYSRPVQFYSLRKSGTNLIKKFMSLIRVREKVYQPQIHIDTVNISRLSANKNYIVSVRDPRDQLVSLANWRVSDSYVAIERGKGNFSKEARQKFLKLKSMTLQERVHFVLSSTFDQGIRYKSYENILSLKEKFPENVYVIKFEDFIGPNRGGSAKNKQIDVLRKIGQICRNKIFPKNRLVSCSNEMMGETSTFTTVKVKVGQWKSALSADSIRLVKSELNKYILALGYETDPDWDVAYLEGLEKRKA